MSRDATILLLFGVVALASCGSPCPDARCSTRPLSGGRVQSPVVDAGVPDAPIAADEPRDGGTPATGFSDWVTAHAGDDDQWIRVGTFGDVPEVSVDFMTITQEWKVTNTGDQPADYACELKYTCDSGEEPTDRAAGVLAPDSVGDISAEVHCKAGAARTIQVRCKVSAPQD